MPKQIRVAVDAMGGDNAPGEIVKGAVAALADNAALTIYLVGKEEAVRKALEGLPRDESRVKVVNATEEIGMAEPPVLAIRTKKDSSIVKALNMVKNGECDAYVSAGSTGATLVGGQVIVGRIKGVERAPLAPFIPTEKGESLLIDCGANVDARASQLVQFARIGSVYMKMAKKIAQPRVALVNIGTEEEKGNALVREAFPLLKNCTDINFTGNIEARDIPAGAADVIVCEAFTGNVILKMYEGVSRSMLHIVKGAMQKNLKSKLGALLLKDALKESLEEYGTERYGGAPMLGLNGLVVKAHGNSKADAIRNAVLQCAAFQEMNVNDGIRDLFRD